MIKAVFTDFYGTLVHEDGEVVRKIRDEIFITGRAVSRAEIGAYWQREFQALTERAFGEDFMTQREIERLSLMKTTDKFGSAASVETLSEMLFDHWIKPPAFEEAHSFFETSPLPIYIVSNIDRQDILNAVRFHNFTPAGIFTSEDARSYKPRRELFDLALKTAHINAAEAVHIGDSLSSDVRGAASLGINAVWLNRGHRDVPHGIISVGSLNGLFGTPFF